jgi:methionyl-tRNA formyltransferase
VAGRVHFFSWRNRTASYSCNKQSQKDVANNHSSTFSTNAQNLESRSRGKVRCAAGTVLSADKTGIVVGCGENALYILELQREGGRRLTAGEFLAGFPLPAGLRLE